MEEEKYSIETFNQLFANHKGKFVHFARTYVDDIVIAEDIAIESIIDYWENRN
ncbi:MAG: RNA polymerase sigma-70 factor, partial [Bacteroidales bacterium]|nr:RNA polymerase sigma-70 factor [Bacteroidales bacterium]